MVLAEDYLSEGEVKTNLKSYLLCAIADEKPVTGIVVFLF
jgi:hypothetical protein